MKPSVASDLDRIAYAEQKLCDLLQAMRELNLHAPSATETISDALADAKLCIKTLSDELDGRSVPTFNQEQWEALNQAETRIYRNTGSPTYGWTDVVEPEDSAPMFWIWQQCESYFENMDEDWNRLTQKERDRKIAHRLARINAMMVYGPEYLLI
jgi:hypothetical protein